MNQARKDNVRLLADARAKTLPGERPEPSSARVESAMLFQLMTPDLASAEATTTLHLLSPEHLFNPANQAVFAAMQALATASVTIEVVTLCDKLRNVPAPVGGWERYLAETIPSEAANAEARPSEYAKILLEKWRLRETIRTCRQTIADAEGHAEFSDLAAAANARLAEIADTHGDASLSPTATTYDIVRDVWENISAATEQGRPIGVSWGFDVLDERIGRLQQPGYVIIGGRSGQGKTQLGWQTGMNIGTRPVDPETGMMEGMYYGSYEMARVALLTRGICNEANVPTKVVLSGRIPRQRDAEVDGAQCPSCGIEYRGVVWMGLPTNSRGERVCRTCVARVGSVDVAPVPDPLPSAFERLVAASDLVSGTPIFIDERPCTPKELAERFKRVRDRAAEGRMKTRNGRAYPKCILRTIVIDSIQNMLPPPGASNRSRQVEVQAISRSVLNDVCKACKVSTIGLVQLNRGIDSQKERRPQLKDIREAGDIEYDADEILFVHREQYYLRENTPPELRNIADIVHGKGRSGIDLESAPARLWFAGGMFFDGPAEGWAAWEEKHGQRGT